jgi:hypothetical protein
MEDSNTRACGNESTLNTFIDDFRFPTFTNSLLYHDDYRMQMAPNCPSDQKVGGLTENHHWYPGTMVDTHCSMNQFEAILV